MTGVPSGMRRSHINTAKMAMPTKPRYIKISIEL